jgi:uncharacterized protein (TIRG00374 family)
LAKSSSARRFGWPSVLGVAISALLLWWTLHDVRLADVWDRLRGVRVLPFLAAIVAATATFPLRTVRWRYLLHLEGSPLPFVPLWHATAIGFMANNILPARAGEFARAYAAHRLTGVRFTTAFASIAVERVLDGITLVGFLAVAIWAGGFATDATIGGATLGGIVRGSGTVFTIALIAAMVVVYWPAPALKLGHAVSHQVLPERWARRLMSAAEGVLSGLDVLRSPRRLAGVTVWSLIVWGTNAASFWFAMIAFRIEAPLSAPFLVLAIVGFGVAIPSTPGFFGPFEAASRASLALYGISAARSVSYAIGYHLGGFLPITLLGLWSLSRAHLHLADLRGGAEPPDGDSARAVAEP